MDYIFGCNYWASNAGTEMWREFDEKAIRKDLKALTENGITHLRVFPNWRDFQPATQLYGWAGTKKDIAPAQGGFFENDSYTDESMMDKFDTFLNICEEYNLKLIVAILTGWMSGRLFVPPILEEKNLYTDPLAIRLEQKFIKSFVSRFKNRDCIIAWGIGNECNCLSTANRDEASAWTGNVANAIKACDNKRPVISDMHGLGISNEWQIKDLAEHCDILTTHPYPQFVPHCFKDGMNSFRTFMHAPCENKYYSEIGGKPCFSEEIGNLGPMNCDDETVSNFVKVSVYQSYINKQPGFMWWCACDQSQLDTAPYQWTMLERELGIMDKNGNPNAILKAMNEASKKLKTIQGNLSEPETDIVCITTQGQDNWGVSYMAYSLARQAGLNLRFAHSEYGIPNSNYYMLPSVCGDTHTSKRRYFELKEKVYNGATLYVSNHSGYFTEFSEFFGIETVDTKIVNETRNVTFNNEIFALDRTYKRIIKEKNAQVLARDDEGNPAITMHKYGKGKVIYLNFPLEQSFLEKEDVFEENYSNIYKFIFKEILDNKPFTTDNKNIGAFYCENKVVLLNYAKTEEIVTLPDKTEIKIQPYDFEIVEL